MHRRLPIGSLIAEVIDEPANVDGCQSTSVVGYFHRVVHKTDGDGLNSWMRGQSIFKTVRTGAGWRVAVICTPLVHGSHVPAGHPLNPKGCRSY